MPVRLFLRKAAVGSSTEVPKFPWAIRFNAGLANHASSVPGRLTWALKTASTIKSRTIGRIIFIGVFHSVQNARANGAWHQFQFAPDGYRFGALGGLDIDHHVAYLGIGLQILTRDVDLLFGEYRVDGGQYAGLVTVDVQHAVLARILRQGNFREVDGAHGGSVVAVLDQLAGHLNADILLRLHGAAAHVRGEQHVVHTAQRGEELLRAAGGLVGEDVDRGPGQVAGSQSRRQSLDLRSEERR